MVQQLGKITHEAEYQKLLNNVGDARENLIKNLKQLVRDRISPQLDKDLTPEEWALLEPELERLLWELVTNLRTLYERVAAIERQELYPSGGGAGVYILHKPFTANGAPDILQRSQLVLLGTLDVFRSGLGIYKQVSGYSLAHADEVFLMAEAISDVMVSDYGNGIRKMLSASATACAGDTSCIIPGKLSRHLPLLVNISGAKTSKDIQVAIESAAAPIGSWAVKRQRPLLTITGLVGVQGALEYDDDLPRGGGVGPMATLGVEWTTNLCRSGWDFGVMGSVLDLGQLAFPRVYSHLTGTEPQVGQNSEPGIVQVLSPGLYLRFGVPDMPITLGVGGSRAPGLRCRLTSSGECQSSNAVGVWRVGAFAAVDVTILNLSE
ncbi:hypothetical protein [Hyalangium versicolor]|uniref:hypothetical protein n=1 Tax=Hyalangium versicolor TaxID=2861190 RepID=UPI001CD03EBF|nr:hypothetical protein [Hyalangium versicolor]